VKCVEYSRSFTIVDTGSKHAGSFVDYDASVEKFTCVVWTKGTMKYRCYQDIAPPFFQTDIERTASKTPAIYFNLVNYRDEQGDTYTNEMDCGTSVFGF
jgi:hypothetical protein